jgi:GNAT superfamily N-acetyltransferase
MSLELREVRNRNNLKSFLRLPWKIYKGDPHWVPPLLRELTFTFSPRNPFLNHAEIVPFIALSDEEVVGRIAAIIDRNYIEYWGQGAGFFGFFESIQDQHIACILVDGAKQFLKQRGMDEILGPVNPSTNDECGLLVEGFDFDPYLMMPYNPSHYPALLEGCGLEKAKDLFANFMPEDGFVGDRIQRIVDRVRTHTPGITIRPLNMAHLMEEVQRIKDIYVEAWGGNWGFVPPTDDEMALLVKRLKPIAVPDLVLFADIDGESVGFALALPNYNRVFKRLNGRLGPIGLLKFLYYGRKIDEARLLLLGVKTAYQKRGIETLLYLEIFRQAHQRGYVRGELSWVLEDNHLIQRGIEAVGGKKYKTYRIYRAFL